MRSEQHDSDGRNKRAERALCGLNQMERSSLVVIISVGDDQPFCRGSREDEGQ